MARSTFTVITPGGKMDFFIKDEDQKLAENATDMDDIDMDISPFDGALIIVAMKKGRRVCQQCGELFDPSNPKLRGIEVRMGYTRMLLHAQCSSNQPKPSRYFNDKIRGMQVRRKLADAAKKSQTVVNASEQHKNKIVA